MSTVLNIVLPLLVLVSPSILGAFWDGEEVESISGDGDPSDQSGSTSKYSHLLIIPKMVLVLSSLNTTYII